MNRTYAIVALIILSTISGCVQPGCLDCDDGNPCTQDECTDGKCTYKGLNGPVEGCFGSGGCIEYSCFSGECLPQRVTKCCGNGLCDEGEIFSACPGDCQATCFDGMRNQREDGVDCGGPCSPCESEELNGIQRISTVRQIWRENVENYTSAISRYNDDKNASALKSAAIESYSRAENIQDLIGRMNMSGDFRNLSLNLNASVGAYMKAIHFMVLYSDTSKDRYRVTSNDLLSNSLDVDRIFVEDYNVVVDRYNDELVRCSNHLLDDSEESIDCGGVCKKECATVINVTKHVTVRLDRGPATLKLNVSSPAIDYPPQQTVLASYYNPKPDYIETSADGNQYLIWELEMPYFSVKEIDIIKTIRLYRTSWQNASVSGYFEEQYIRANNNSQLTEEICYRANLLKKESQNTRGRAMKIEQWLADNIKYERNNEAFGAQFTYNTRLGACDEHADLFISMARCMGIPSRRVTGYMLNASRVEGHAWAEYYDGGWYYIDPSTKNPDQAFTPENKHITACVGDGAYNCGLGYTYTYTGQKPMIDVKERVYVS